MNYSPEEFEILSEKALPEGHIDLLIKDKLPQGKSRKIIIEVKTGNASLNDISQIRKYMIELKEEGIKRRIGCQKSP